MVRTVGRAIFGISPCRIQEPTETDGFIVSGSPGSHRAQIFTQNAARTPDR